MILATCTVSTFATQRGAHNIAMRNAQDDDEQPQQEDHILIPVANEQTVSELVSLSTTLKKAKSRNGLYALTTRSRTPRSKSGAAKSSTRPPKPPPRRTTTCRRCSATT